MRRAACPTHCASGQVATTSNVAGCVLCHVRSKQLPLGNEKRALSDALEEVVAQRRLRKEWLWLEFGAFEGRSTMRMRNASLIWARRGGVFAFDSFLGLPSDWRTEPGTFPAGKHDERLPLSKGRFSKRGCPPFHLSGIRWMVGWFNETLPRFLETHHAPVGVVHIDCDLYSSTDTVLRLLEPRLRAGTIIIFDELLNYPGWQLHEARAFVELLHRTGYGYRILSASMRQVITREEPLRAAMRQGQRQMLREDVAVELVWPATLRPDASPSDPQPSEHTSKYTSKRAGHRVQGTGAHARAGHVRHGKSSGSSLDAGYPADSHAADSHAADSHAAGSHAVGLYAADLGHPGQRFCESREIEAGAFVLSHLTLVRSLAHNKDPTKRAYHLTPHQMCLTSHSHVVTVPPPIPCHQTCHPSRVSCGTRVVALIHHSFIKQPRGTLGSGSVG